MSASARRKVAQAFTKEKSRRPRFDSERMTTILKILEWEDDGKAKDMVWRKWSCPEIAKKVPCGDLRKDLLRNCEKAYNAWYVLFSRHIDGNCREAARCIPFDVFPFIQQNLNLFLSCLFHDPVARSHTFPSSPHQVARSKSRLFPFLCLAERLLSAEKILRRNDQPLCQSSDL